MKRASFTDYPLINRILANAFIDNKSTNYVLKREKDIHLLSKVIDYSIYKGEKFGDIWVNDDKTACAICINPQKEKTTVMSIKRDIKLIFEVIGFSKLMKVLKKESITKKKLPTNMEFIHLWYLGVLPEEQGKAKGTSLLRDLITYYKSKGDKGAICLETSTLRNLPFYEKAGFEIYDVENFGFDYYFLIHKF